MLQEDITATYNYHTHTTRCSHATGTPEEYIIRAMENGVRYLGFSDHMPYLCENGQESYYRVPVAEVDAYVSELRTLRDKYAGKIDIRIGFEMEYYPKHFKKMLQNAIAYGGEYLILGEHFLDDESVNDFYSMCPTKDVSILQTYVSRVVDGIKSGVFTYVAHPDLFYFTGEEKDYRKEVQRLCVASREANIPLEINFLGIREKRNYPYELFWRVAGEEQAPVTFGFDTHDVAGAFDPDALEKAKQLVQTYDLNYIGKPELVWIQELFCAKNGQVTE